MLALVVYGATFMPYLSGMSESSLSSLYSIQVGLMTVVNSAELSSSEAAVPSDAMALARATIAPSEATTERTSERGQHMLSRFHAWTQKMQMQMQMQMQIQTQTQIQNPLPPR
jgi:hypothetical protein